MQKQRLDGQHQFVRGDDSPPLPRMLLDQLPVALLGIGPSGVVEYANPACASVLGYDDVQALIRRPLPALLAERADSSPAACLEHLRAAETIVRWNHRDGHPVATRLSSPDCLQPSNHVLLFAVTDVTEWAWELGPRTAARMGSPSHAG